MITHFTEGGRRVLRLAESLGLAAQAAQIEPAHLLWALWLDESRGAEILREHGVTDDLLESEFPKPAGFESIESARVGAPDAATLSGGEALEAVLNEARQHVANIGRHVEIGTEHLLLALTLVESPVKGLLHEYGLGPDVAREQSVRQSGVTSEPIDAGIRLAATAAPATDRTDLFRILDASANRAREGLRVIEDYVRFSLNDHHLTERVKECRHRLAETMRMISPAALLAARDTRGDVGTTIHSRHEMNRQSLTDVVRADFKRVQEACRTLEEFGKTLSVEFSRGAGQVRYSAYTLERAVLTTAAAVDRFDGRDLYLILTESLCPRGSGRVVRGALAAGVGVIQIREKQMRDRELLSHARRVREWTAKANCLLIINDRPDLAALVEADGVHVGQDELPVAEARRIVGPDRLVGVSTHDIGQAREAVLDGADCIGVGPVFATTTKSFTRLAGLDYVSQVAVEVELPGYCIGGIHLGNIDRVLAAGGRRVAVSSAVCGAEDPEGAARELLEKLRTAREASGASHESKVGRIET